VPAVHAAPLRRWLGDGAPFSVFAVLVLVAGCAATALSMRGWTPKAEHLLAGLVLAAAFAVARRVAIEVDVRRSTWRITVTEVPLVIGLLVWPSPVVAVAFMTVVLVARLLRRDSWAKLIVNVATAGLTVVLTGLTFHWLDERLAGFPTWLVLFIAFLFGHGVTSMIGLLAIRLGSNNLAGAARLVAHVYVTGVLSAVAGLVGAVIVINVRWGWLLVVLMAIALGAFYRTYYGVLREQRDLGLLSRVSLVVTGAGRNAAEGVTAETPETPETPEAAPAAQDPWLPAAELIRQQLNATRVVLHREAFPDPGLRSVVAGQPLPGSAIHDDVSILYSRVLAGGPDGEVQHVDVESAPPDVRRELEHRGAREALVVPLRGAHQLLGILEVHDLQSRLRGFSAADVRLVGTLASHLATAMDNRRLLARLRHDAYHDPLTGLLNRTGFRQMTAEALRGGKNTVVLRVDLDLQTTVSEALGYTWGDRLVVAAGRRMREAMGTEAALARLEANSFAVLLLERSEAEAHKMAEELRGVIGEPYPVDRLVVEAAGVAGYASSLPAGSTDGESDVDTLLQHADVAVRAARNGKDGVRGYAPAMGQIFLRRFQLVTQFRQALDSGQVEVHYQPKVALPGRQVVGAEALVRWSHPEYGRLDPDEFVPVVEATGLVDALTSFVMERALTKIREWLDRGLRMSVAVNLSVRNLADESFPDRVAEALLRYDTPPELLTFELTESSVMEAPERSMPVLRRLHALGVVLAVDDFGTGYSSLAYLRRLPVDEVKIDKSFVLGMGTDLGDMAVVRSIVELGHSLDLAVVAEGVEDDAARDQLVGMGCDIAQGYLISRPLSEDRFEAWLQARTVRARGTRDETVLTLVH
jgi:diguanylate cyclase (GGDEF)-like protein